MENIHIKTKINRNILGFGNASYNNKLVYISKKNLKTANDNDICDIILIDENEKGYIGNIINICQRSNKKIFGIIRFISKYIGIYSPKLGKDRTILINKNEYPYNFSISDMVTVEIKKWGSSDHNIIGKIIKYHGNFVNNDFSKNFLLPYEYNIDENYCINYIEEMNILISNYNNIFNEEKKK